MDVSVSQWDLLHIIYSVDNPPNDDRSQQQLDEVCARLMDALQSLPSRSAIEPLPSDDEGGNTRAA